MDTGVAKHSRVSLALSVSLSSVCEGYKRKTGMITCITITPVDNNVAYPPLVPLVSQILSQRRTLNASNDAMRNRTLGRGEVAIECRVREWGHTAVVCGRRVLIQP